MSLKSSDHSRRVHLCILCQGQAPSRGSVGTWGHSGAVCLGAAAVCARALHAHTWPRMSEVPESGASAQRWRPVHPGFRAAFAIRTLLKASTGFEAWLCSSGTWR